MKSPNFEKKEASELFDVEPSAMPEAACHVFLHGSSVLFLMRESYARDMFNDRNHKYP